MQQHHAVWPARPQARALAAGQGLSLADWWRRFTHWRERRRTVATLAGLSDRALDDIGISRCDIDWIAGGGRHPRIVRRAGHRGRS
ncbi:MAG: DUF1127 domain-containing protein [Hyphomicrobiaceae bacterium]